MMNSKNFNSQQYERYLSPFGKKVLGNLMKILLERNDCNKVHVRDGNNSGQKKCVLTFGESYNSPPLNLCHRSALASECEDITIDKISNTGPTDFESFVVTTSDGLLKTATGHVLTENVDKRCMRTKIDVQYNVEADLPLNEQRGVDNGTVSDSIREPKGHIEWDDIFDKQLLDDLNILDTDCSINSQKDVTEYNGYNLVQPDTECEINLNYGKFNTEPESSDMTSDINSNSVNLITLNVPITGDIFNSPMQGSIEEKSIIDHSTVVQTDDPFSNHYYAYKTPKNSEIKKRKLKRQNSSKIIDDIPNKVKIPPAELKISFRKQKYTKTVKTWLNNVDSEKFEDVMEFQNTSNNEQEHDTNKQEDLENKHAKKFVQAQLRNKGGVMKYGVPKTKDLLEKPKDIFLSTRNNGTNITTAIKDKKAKLKFIPPIKSQIPVQDITYTIINCNDDSFMENVTELSAVKCEEIEMILIFSNGFCQLNSHYTEDTCTVEGVMFQINNVIYYWRGVYKQFCNTMGMLIKHNTIVCYDGKNLLKYFTSQHSTDVNNSDKINVLHVQIGANLIDPDNTPENFTDVQKLVSSFPEYTIATECIQQKSAWYLSMLGECFLKLKTLLIEYKLWNVFVEIEMRVLPIVAEMENRGVRVDTERLKAMEDTILTRMKATEQACHAAAGRVFQVNSTVQVRSILYEELQLDTKSNVRIKETVCKGEKSTSESMLRSLIALHPLPKLILEYRHLHKAHATFLAGISNQVKEGIVRPTWVQTAAATGRIASNNPNLQAIPKAPFSLVLFPPDSTEEKDLTEPNQILNFRSVYIPREGHILLAADFKHIECRVFAYAAADTSLLEALASPDLFRVLAARWLNKNEEEVSSADRERTKRIVYASLYGAGTRRLMEILGVSYDQTLSIMASFNRTFPSLKSFGRAVVARCARLGGRLTTLCGRGRTFANITSDDFALRSHAERQAINFIVQGSAADLCKLAMVVTEQRLRGRLLLQIHDELVWEVEHRDLPTAAAEIKAAMEGIGHTCGLAVTLPVAISAGRSWGEMQDYTPTTATLTNHS